MKTNWWITVYDDTEDHNIVEEWMIAVDATADEARIEAELAKANMTDIEILPGVRVGDWSMREATITCVIEGGVLQNMIGLPHGWTYDVVDLDVRRSDG